jgi:hypothetical protein
MIKVLRFTKVKCEKIHLHLHTNDMATTKALHKEVNSFGSMHIVEPWDPKYIFATIWAIAQTCGLGTWS